MGAYFCFFGQGYLGTNPTSNFLDQVFF